MGDLVTRPLVRLRDLDGHSVTLVLADGSHLGGVTLVLAGRGGARSRKGRRLAPALRPYGTGVPWPRGDGGTGPAGSAVRPHGPTAAGAVRSGFELGLYCVGSSIGLMAIFGALSVMSVAWISVIAALVAAQKLLPARAAIDVPLALAIVGLGALIVIAPSSVLGLMPAM